MPATLGGQQQLGILRLLIRMLAGDSIKSTGIPTGKIYLLSSGARGRGGEQRSPRGGRQIPQHHYCIVGSVITLIYNYKLIPYIFAKKIPW